jgi:hypothetical protein
VVEAPGATVPFFAQAWAFVTEVIAAALSDRCAGKVEAVGMAPEGVVDALAR